MPDISLEEAWDRIDSEVTLADAEVISSSAAFNRTIRQNIVSPVPIPLFDKSVMDGYCVHPSDLGGESVVLRLAGATMAGDEPQPKLTEGSTVMIMTGGTLPARAAAVVPREQARVIEQGAGESSVELKLTGIRTESNVIRRGTLISPGETVVQQRQTMTAATIGLLCELGVDQIAVSKRPSVAILATGNELQDGTSPLRIGEIRNSNGPMLEALTLQSSCCGTITNLGIARDQADALRLKIEQGLQSDVLLLSGGVSVGNLDLVPTVLAEAGVRTVFHGVRIKPGKPVFFGRHSRGTLVFGLPGNPVSTFACFQLFVRPAIACLLGIAWRERAFRPYRLAQAFSCAGNRLTFWPGMICPRTLEDVNLLAWQGSSDLRTLADADVLIRIRPGDTHLPQGMEVLGISIRSLGLYGE